MHKKYLLDMRSKIDKELKKIGCEEGVVNNRQMPEFNKLNFVT